MEKKEKLRTRLLDILGRHLKDEDDDLVDREFVRAVVARSEAEYKRFLVDVNE